MDITRRVEDQSHSERLAQWSDGQIYQSLWGMLSRLLARVNFFLADVAA
jgi:hypothetical protein